MLKRRRVSKRRTVVVRLIAGKMPDGMLYARAVPESAEIRVGDSIKWIVDARNGFKNVRPAHFRLIDTWMDSVPFEALKRNPAGVGGPEFTTRAKRSGFIRIIKYDIMVGNTVVADPDVQIREE
jgi:hypothetical protein